MKNNMMYNYLGRCQNSHVFEIRTNAKPIKRKIAQFFRGDDQ